jgi:ribose transport system substrate-binding protein
MTMNNPFYEIINSELLKQIESHNDRLITYDPLLDEQKQIEQVESLIAQEVDGIFINPVDYESLQPTLQKAYEAGIPVIAIDTPAGDDPSLVSTVVSNNYRAGQLCALDLMENMESANIVLLCHSQALSAKERIQGFVDTIEQNENFTIIDSRECLGQLEVAMPAMEEMLAEHEDIDVVMALNDPSALGALAALQAHDEEDVLVYGVDGTPDLKEQMLTSSQIAGTAAQSPISIGQQAAAAMYAYLNGDEVSNKIILDVELITHKNLSDYEIGGWQ